MRFGLRGSSDRTKRHFLCECAYEMQKSVGCNELKETKKQMYRQGVRRNQVNALKVSRHVLT